MIILPLDSEFAAYLQKKKASQKICLSFFLQKILFEQNPFYPGLNTEILEPREMRVWSFRIDRKYRAIFIFLNSSTVEIVDVNNHYD